MSFSRHFLLPLLLLSALAPHAASAPPILRVALLQMAPEGANVAANFEKAEQFCRKAASKGADIAVMPEMWSTGFSPFDPEDADARAAYRDKALATDSAPVQAFAALARELNMAIALTYLQAADPAPRNVVTLFDRHGSEVFTYAKVHTSDFNPLEAATTPGEEFFVGELDTNVGPVAVGAMICFDREQPESARILMLKGAELILTPNASKLDELRLAQFRVRAWENAVGVAMANYAHPRNHGRSVAYNAAGEELVRAGKKEGVYMADFDLEALRARRAETIWGNAYRRPHRYDTLTVPGGAPVWERQNADGTRYDPAKR